jgi:hypothetical protein
MGECWHAKNYATLVPFNIILAFANTCVFTRVLNFAKLMFIVTLVYVRLRKWRWHLQQLHYKIWPPLEFTNRQQWFQINGPALQSAPSTSIRTRLPCPQGELVTVQDGQYPSPWQTSARRFARGGWITTDKTSFFHRFLLRGGCHCAPAGVSGRTGNDGCANEVGPVTNKRSRLILEAEAASVVINTDGDRYAPFVGLAHWHKLLRIWVAVGERDGTGRRQLGRRVVQRPEIIERLKCSGIFQPKLLDYIIHPIQPCLVQMHVAGRNQGLKIRVEQKIQRWSISSVSCLQSAVADLMYSELRSLLPS